MEQAQCPVCLELHDTGSTLLDRRLKPSMEQHTVTHFDLCPAHKKMRDDGFVALIELTREPRADEDALCVPRTGKYLHIRASAWPNIFNTPAPPKGIAMTEAGMIDKLMSKIQVSPSPN